MDNSGSIGGKPLSTTPVNLHVPNKDTKNPNVKAVDGKVYIEKRQGNQQQDNNISKTRSVTHVSDSSRKNAEKACKQKLDVLYAALLPNAIQNLPNENISNITINGKIVYPRPTNPPISDEEYKKSMQSVTNALAQNAPDEQEARSETIQELKQFKEILLKDMSSEDAQKSLINLIEDRLIWSYRYNENSEEEEYTVEGSVHRDSLMEELKQAPLFLSAKASEEGRVPKLTKNVDGQDLEGSNQKSLPHNAHYSAGPTTPATPATPTTTTTPATTPATPTPPPPAPPPPPPPNVPSSKP
ncbi:MAG: hypothetical protein KAG53_00015 [Endozoicomonadaceae bacterium]|nr:hypothetical protein [Endozoicomonadaceae bacterium]